MQILKKYVNKIIKLHNKKEAEEKRKEKLKRIKLEEIEKQKQEKQEKQNLINNFPEEYIIFREKFMELFKELTKGGFFKDHNETINNIYII